MNQLFDAPIPARLGVEAEKWDLLEGKHGPEIVPLSVADMELRSPAAIVSALTDLATSGLWGYTGWGDRYFNAIHHWMKTRHHWEVRREWVVQTAGVIHGINAAVRAFTKPGDGIVIQPPVYPPFGRAVTQNGRTLLKNPLKKIGTRYEMDYEDLEAKLSLPSTTALILCSPHNPVGRVWSREELKRLGDLCLKYQVFVISDEIHCDLCQPQHPHTVYATLGEEYAQNCVIGTSASKTFSLAGLCCANLLVPNPVHKQALEEEVIRSCCFTQGTFGTLATEVGYESCAPWLDELIGYLWGNYETLCQWMTTHLPQCPVAPLEGTYLAWIDFTSLGLSEEELVSFLEGEAKLYLSHGRNYGAPGFMRVNLACSRQVLTQALERLGEALQHRGIAPCKEGDKS